MANTYKFKGVALATTAETALLTALATETIIIKSIRVTNNTANTPTVSLNVGDFTILKTQSLTANTSVELLTVPLVIEKSIALKATASATDSIHFGISYLNIT